MASKFIGIVAAIAIVALCKTTVFAEELAGTEERTIHKVPNDTEEVALLNKKYQPFGKICLTYRDYLVDEIKKETDESVAKELYSAIFDFDTSILQRIRASPVTDSQNKYDGLCERIKKYKLELKNIWEDQAAPIKSANKRGPYSQHALKCQTGHFVYRLNAACNRRGEPLKEDA